MATRKTKLEKAQTIVKSNPKATRQQVLARFVARLDMTPGCASRYYHIIKSA